MVKQQQQQQSCSIKVSLVGNVYKMVEILAIIGCIIGIQLTCRRAYVGIKKKPTMSGHTILPII